MDTWVEVQQVAHEVPISGSYVRDTSGITSGTEDPFVGTDQPVSYANPVDGQIYPFHGGKAEYGEPVATFYTTEVNKWTRVDNQLSSVHVDYSGVAIYITGQIIGTRDADSAPDTGLESQVTIPAGTLTDDQKGGPETTTVAPRTFAYPDTVWYDAGPASPGVVPADTGLPQAAQRFVDDADGAGALGSSHPLLAIKSFISGNPDEAEAAFDSVAEEPDVKAAGIEAGQQPNPIKFLRGAIEGGVGGAILNASAALVEAGAIAGSPEIVGTTLILGGVLTVYDSILGTHHVADFEQHLAQAVSAITSQGH